MRPASVQREALAMRPLPLEAWPAIAGRYREVADALMRRLPEPPPWWARAVGRLRARPRGDYTLIYIVALAAATWRTEGMRGRSPFERAWFDRDFGRWDFELEPPERFLALADGRL